MRTRFSLAQQQNTNNVSLLAAKSHALNSELLVYSIADSLGLGVLSLSLSTLLRRFVFGRGEDASEWVILVELVDRHGESGKSWMVLLILQGVVAFINKLTPDQTEAIRYKYKCKEWEEM